LIFELEGGSFLIMKISRMNPIETQSWKIETSSLKKLSQQKLLGFFLF